MRRIIILLHVTFWVLFFVFKYIDYSHDLGSYRSFLLIGVPLVFNVVGAYLHYFLLLPLILTKRWILYVFGLITLLLFISVIRTYAEGYFLSDLFKSDYYTTWTVHRFINTVWNTISFILFIALIGFTIDRFILENQKRELENEKLNAELNYLKAQINPHFLFNTLHNLNYLTQIKSDQATSVIMKLSNIMRYMIYESNKHSVRITQEMDYIRDYLDLEMIRLNNQVDLKVEIEGINEEVRIAPLLLIPLVENAFKHGINDRESGNWINLKLTYYDGVLDFAVANGLPAKSLVENQESGFGLKNLRKRLDLSYQDSYQLEINKTNDQHMVVLKLQLK